MIGERREKKKNKIIIKLKKIMINSLISYNEKLVIKGNF